MSAVRPVTPAPRRPQPSTARPPAVALKRIADRIAALEEKSGSASKAIDEVRAGLREAAAAITRAKARKASVAPAARPVDATRAAAERLAKLRRKHGGSSKEYVNELIREASAVVARREATNTRDGVTALVRAGA